jgi:ribonucleotide reductase alpha subunit
MIKKRDGRLVEFDGLKIIAVIMLAKSTSSEKFTTTIAYDIAKKIEETIDTEIVDVEEIQNMVEKELLANNLIETARRYMRYRDERAKERTCCKPVKNQLLTDEFISKYKHLPLPMESELGKFIYYRTYSRFIQEKGRRETWYETIRRAVEYNCSLAPTTKDEAEKIFDNIFNLRQFPSGRTLWVGGTSVANEYPMSNYNCAFQIINKFSDFIELFYLLMVGSGVGIRILKSDVIRLPKVRYNHELIHEDYTYTIENKCDNTSIDFKSNDMVLITIGDSKEGWSEALQTYFDLITKPEYKNIKTIRMNYDFVRPKGMKLKKFGGTASGHESLKTMFVKINKIIKKASIVADSTTFKLKPINCMDIANIIGENVVSGGVRRCLPEGSMVHTKDGLIPIENVKTGMQVLTDDGYQNVIDFVYQGKQEIVTIKHQFGKFRCTDKHRMAIMTDIDKYEWKMAKDIKPDDRLVSIPDAKDVKNLELSNYIKSIDIIQKLIPITVKEVVYTGEIEETYDISVENNHCFICEGILTHNTSEIVLIDSDDEECINAKTNLYIQQGNDFVINDEISHRRMSNNTIIYESKPTREKWNWHIKTMRYSGEPAFMNLEAARKRRYDANGCNPCGEILLDNKGTCNLTTVNIMAFVKDGKLDIEGLLNAQRLSAKMGYRMTCVEMEMPEWNEILHRDKLTGCSLTGWQDIVNALNLSREEEKKLLKSLNKAASDSANNYADKLGLPQPKLVTTVKPEGSLSLLPLVSSGVHYSHSPYYIRRVRIASHDPLCRVCEDLEYPIFAETGQTEENCTTKVIEFPVKAPEGITKYDVSALQQLENYKMFMENYVQHNTSITVHVRENEWELVEQWVWDNWDDVVAISFLSLDDSFYPLQPYESITKEEYEERLANMKPFDPSLISKYEVENVDYELLESGCEGGACPIR